MDFFVWSANPVLVSLGGLQIHWYGALFALAIWLGSQMMAWIYTREGYSPKSLDTWFIYSVIGIIVGARLGHCLFYDPAYYLSNPLKILAVWEGGLASHGGGLGIILATWLYQKKYQFKLLWLLDRLALPTALFGFFVRTANFINSEIVGMPSTVPWAIVFSTVDDVPRHAVQLYEAISYLTIFILLLALYRFSTLKEQQGRLLGLLLCTLFSARFLLEFLKVQQAAYTSELIINTGQMLSIPFFLIGCFLLFRPAPAASPADTNDRGGQGNAKKSNDRSHASKGYNSRKSNSKKYGAKTSAKKR